MLRHLRDVRPSRLRAGREGFTYDSQGRGASVTQPVVNPAQFGLTGAAPQPIGYAKDYFHDGKGPGRAHAGRQP